MKKKEEKSLSHIIREEEVTRAKEEHPFSHLIIYFFFSPLRGWYSNWEKSRALGGTEKLFPPKNRGRICTFFKKYMECSLTFFCGKLLAVVLPSRRLRHRAETGGGGGRAFFIRQTSSFRLRFRATQSNTPLYFGLAQGDRV